MTFSDFRDRSGASSIASPPREPDPFPASPDFGYPQPPPQRPFPDWDEPFPAQPLPDFDPPDEDR